MGQGGVVVVAGATGNLGGRIVKVLVERGANVRALIRTNTSPAALGKLQQSGATPMIVDYNNPSDLHRAVADASCVLSALAGLRDVIVGMQSQLLDAAVEAKVPRFIPSDFAIDFLKMPNGTNRNLDLRREFDEQLDSAPIKATSILCGMFMDLLVGPAPIILKKLKRVVYWRDQDQLLDFTTIDDAAAFTAAAAMDDTAPRYLRCAGDVVSARGLADVASDVTGDRFKTFRAGGLGRLRAMIKIMQKFSPGRDELYPPWQGMQYLHNMFDGRAKLAPLDNDRYPNLRWTSVKEMLSAEL